MSGQEKAALREFKALDESLRCGICCEYFETAMITVCSHHFCSICVRRYMSYKSECPTCFRVTSEVELKNSRLVDDIVENYLKIRLKIVELLAKSKENVPESKDDFDRKFSSLTSDELEPKKCTKSKTALKTMNSKRPSVKRTLPEKDGNDAELESPELKTNQDQLKVACPVCDGMFDHENMNSHLDFCLKRMERKEPTDVNINTKTRKSLPKLVYKLLSDRELKKKLKEFGLSVQGTRQELVKRHHTFTILYNAECDALRPRSVRSLVQQIESEEPQRTVTMKRMKLNYTRNSKPDVIESEQKKYRAQHKLQFDSLINKVKNRSQPNDDVNLVASDDETNNVHNAGASTSCDVKKCLLSTKKRIAQSTLSSGLKRRKGCAKLNFKRVDVNPETDDECVIVESSPEISYSPRFIPITPNHGKECNSDCHITPSPTFSRDRDLDNVSLGAKRSLNSSFKLSVQDDPTSSRCSTSTALLTMSPSSSPILGHVEAPSKIAGTSSNVNVSKSFSDSCTSSDCENLICPSLMVEANYDSGDESPLF